MGKKELDGILAGIYAKISTSILSLDHELHRLDETAKQQKGIIKEIHRIKKERREMLERDEVVGAGVKIDKKLKSLMDLIEKRMQKIDEKLDRLLS